MPETKGVLSYDSNNSGGSWWLNDAAWERLEKAGWNVHWGKRSYSDLLKPMPKKGTKWLGALARSAAKRFNSAQEGISEWEQITQKSSSDLGCSCCGPPHSFSWEGDDGSSSNFYAESIGSSLVES